MSNGRVRTWTILLVEDHADSALALKRLLELNGHMVFVAATVANARHLASQHRCDLLIADLELPDGSGIELFRELKSTSPIRGVAVTGHSGDQCRRECENAGFSHFLRKPVQFTELLAAVHSGPVVEASPPL